MSKVDQVLHIEPGTELRFRGNLLQKAKSSLKRGLNFCFGVTVWRICQNKLDQISVTLYYASHSQMNIIFLRDKGNPVSVDGLYSS